MPNPLIPLGFRPTQELQDPAAIQQRAFALRDLLDQRKIREMQIQKAERDLAEEEELKSIFRRHAGDLEKALPEVMGVSPTTGIALRGKLTEQQKASLELQLKTIEKRSAQAGRFASIAGSIIANPAMYQPGIQQALSEQLITPEVVAQLPAEPTAEVIEQLKGYQQQALTAQQQLEEARKVIDEQRKATEHQWKVEDRPFAATKTRADAGKAEADATEAQLGIAAQTVPNDQASYTVWRNALPQAIQPRIPPFFSPSAVQIVQRMGMSADQQASDADRDATREQNAAFHKDTVKHQNAMLGVARGQLGVAQGNLQARTDALKAVQMKGSEEYRKQYKALLDFEKAIGSYETLLDQTYGRTLVPGTPEYAKLVSAFTDIQMQQKNAYQLGALAGPDIGILDNAITNPMSWGGRWAGKDSLKAQLEVAKDVAKRNKNSLDTAYQRQSLQQNLDFSNMSTGMILQNLVNSIGGTQ